jgi:hypothetical protein
MDADKDGSISRAEFDAHHAAMKKEHGEQHDKHKAEGGHEHGEHADHQH